jgi:branched-chain amino acid aminotransferase
MEFEYFSRNGELLPIAQAVVPLSSIEYQYGFGVYETIRIENGAVYFLDDHIERLTESARIIGLNHSYAPAMIAESIRNLIQQNSAQTCNLKILLLGGPAKEYASIFILCLNPLFPDKKLYRDGARCVTREYERAFPHAKTLNMLQSYLAYRKAKEAGAYDALFVDRSGCITEGTRTNFFCIKGKTLFTPDEKDILLGVTRKAVLKVAAGNGFDVVQKDIRPVDLENYDGAFLTSTSSKIMPIRVIDDCRFSAQPESLRELMKLFDVFLETSGGKL